MSTTKMTPKLGTLAAIPIPHKSAPGYAAIADVDAKQTIGWTTSVDDARAIVTACNMHDELVATLKELLAWCDENGGVPTVQGEPSCEEKAARAVLAKVEGGAT